MPWKEYLDKHLTPRRPRPEGARQNSGHRRLRPTGFDSGALAVLNQHSWPGNVRELDHAIERAVLLAEGDHIKASDLGLRSPRDGAPKIEDMSLEEVEALLISKALSRHGGNISQAAEALGLSRSALYRRLDKYGLS